MAHQIVSLGGTMGPAKIVGVSGCRLSDGRLHLGHYLGCFHPQKLRHVSQVFFVIQDQETNQLAGISPEKRSLLLLLSQLYNLPVEIEIIPCLQTAVFPAYAPLYDFARAATTLRTLETAHPKKTNLRQATALALRNYLFPIDQAVQFLAFGAKFVLMNDDNVRFFHLARRLHKKLVNHPRQPIPKPMLLLKPCPRLIGSDGKKMAKAQANCIFFMDDDRTVVEQIKNYARRLGWRWTKDSVWTFEAASDRSQKLAPDSPLMSISTAFGDPLAATELSIDDAPKTVEGLIAQIVPLIAGVRSRTLDSLRSEQSLWDRFQHDNTRAVEQIRSTIEALIS